MFCCAQKKCAKWSEAKYKAENSLQYTENFNCVVVKNLNAKNSGA